MKYLLDTSVISDFVKGHPQVTARLLQQSPNDIAVSVISQMEVEYGLRLNAARDRQLRSKIAALFETVHVLPLATADALAVAVIRAGLHREGRPIGPYDILLAGTAIHHQCIFVTSNTREFVRVPDLQVEDWRE